MFSFSVWFSLSFDVTSTVDDSTDFVVKTELPSPDLFTVSSFAFNFTFNVNFLLPYIALILAFPTFLPLITIFCLYFPFFLIETFFLPYTIFHTTLCFTFFKIIVFFFPTDTVTVFLLSLTLPVAALTGITLSGTKLTVKTNARIIASPFFTNSLFFFIKPPAFPFAFSKC